MAELDYDDLLRAGYYFRPGVGLFTTIFRTDKKMPTFNGSYHLRVAGENRAVSHSELVEAFYFGSISRAECNRKNLCGGRSARSTDSSKGLPMSIPKCQAWLKDVDLRGLRCVQK